MQDFFTFPEVAHAVLPVTGNVYHDITFTIGKSLEPVPGTMSDNFPNPPKPPK